MTEEPTLKPGDVVQLVNVNSGLKVVTVIYPYRSCRLQTPNPTRAVLIDGPRETATGLEVYDVRIADGPHRGKLVMCSPNVVRFVGRAQVKPPKRRGWSFNP